MAKKKVVKKQKPVQSKRRVATASDLSPLTPSLNDLVNALDVALHKDGIHAVMERLDFELGIHALELEDKKQRPGNLTTYELIQSLEKKAKAKKKKKPVAEAAAIEDDYNDDFDAPEIKADINDSMPAEQD